MAKLKPPINIEPTMRDIKELFLDWRLGGYTQDQVVVALGELATEILRFRDEIDSAPREAALADLRRTIRRALAG